jgi:hypothetical protein
MHGGSGHGGDTRSSAGAVTAALAQQQAGRAVSPRYAGSVQNWAMRWHDGSPAWVHERFGWFDPDDYGVDLIDWKTAVSFITAHHYSRCVPALRKYRFGLYHLTGEQPVLCGVAALSVPPCNEVLRGPLPDLAPNRESAEMGRQILLDEVPHAAESWFFAEIRRWLAANTTIRGLVMFSDPELRTRNDGSVLLPGHVGTSYQASNARYVGLGSSGWQYLVDGLVFSNRAKSKILALDTGWKYASQMLVDACAGLQEPLAPLDPAHDDPAEWLRMALKKAGAKRRKHGGCHKYVIPVGRNAREREQVRIAGPVLDYPKLNLGQLGLF